MFTRSYHELMEAMPQSSSTVYGTVPVKDVYGMQYFHTNQYTFPYSRTEAFTTGAYSAGISIGRDGTPAKDTDHNLRSTITSGVSVNIASRTFSLSGVVSLTYNMTVSNTSSSDITIAEIGYKQTCRGAVAPASTSAQDVIFLVDRTVIEPAITIRPGEACVIRYELGTEPWSRMVGDLKVVGWQYGSDGDVAAMIDAARNGDMDLSDYWAVGDMRPCTIGPWTDGSGTEHPEETIDLVITSFDDYEGCGCLMQVDFAEALAAKVRMHPEAANAGGYGITEMCTDTLPALFDAMPAWLRSRMLAFDVKSSNGNSSDLITVTSGNKLALRSEIEVLNTVTSSYAGEGQAVPWYLIANKMRTKRNGRYGSNAAWWLRSPLKGNSAQYVLTKADGSARESSSMVNAQCVAPFLCI